MKKVFFMMFLCLSWYIFDDIKVNAAVTPISYQIAEAFKVNPEIVRITNELNCVFEFNSTSESLIITTNGCGEEINYDNMITTFTFNQSVITYVLPSDHSQLSLDTGLIIPELVNTVSTLLGYSSQEIAAFLGGRNWEALTFDNDGIEATMMILNGDARSGDVFSDFKLDVNNLFGQDKTLWVDDSNDLNPPQDETPEVEEKEETPVVPKEETPPKEINNLPPNPETGNHLPFLAIGTSIGLITIFNIIYKKKNSLYRI